MSSLDFQVAWSLLLSTCYSLRFNFYGPCFSTGPTSPLRLHFLFSGSPSPKFNFFPLSFRFFCSSPPNDVSWCGNDTGRKLRNHTRARIIKDIDEEWQKTQCMPRETSVDVAKELGTSTSTFFKPPCVSVFRCGGCCNEESLTCMNTSASYVSKTVFEISVPFMQVEPVMIKIANHTACKCLPSTARSPFSIIRRSVRHPAEEGCPHAAKHCPIGWIWVNSRCECVMQENPNKKPRDELAICGPHMEFEDSCECVCKRTCTRHYVLNPHNCTCECRENLDSCFLKQKIFHPDTCSCEDGCPFQAKLCANGKLVCAKYFRCPKERRLGSHGTQK